MPRSFQAVNPATGQPVGEVFAVTTPAELDAVVDSARVAAISYAQTSGNERAAFLTSAAERLEALGEPIVQTAMLETALTEARLRGELSRTVGQLRLFAQVAHEGSWVDARIDHGDPTRQPLPKPDLRSMRVPLGPVAMFGASNFPLAFSVAGGDTASALAAGCPVIVKAHPAHPGTSRLVAAVLSAAAQDAVLPASTFSIVYDDGHEVGQALVRHPDVRAVAFTGSRMGGLALVRAAQARPVPIPVFAEMSSVNPMVFTERALASGGPALTGGLSASISGSGGQLCTQPGLLFVPSGAVGDAFLAEVAAQLTAVPICALLTRGIQNAFEDGLALYASHHAVTCLTGVAAGAGAAAQLYSVPIREFSSELSHEVFGPVSLAVRYDVLSEVVRVYGELEGQLTATLHATPEELTEQGELLSVMREKAGRVLFGGFPTGVEVGHATVHGGPYPATSDGNSTSVGTHAITRFTRLLAYQSFPDAALPPELQDGNPRRIRRMVDGVTVLDV